MVGFQKADLKALLASKCKSTGADQHFIEAIIAVESGWNPGLVRYEAGFPWLSNPAMFAPELGITIATETALQRFSFGLGQLMGGTVRGLGFRGSLLDLLDPGTNLEWVIRYVTKVCGKYPDLDDKAAAYNAGCVRRTPSGKYQNQAYVDKVIAALREAA